MAKACLGGTEQSPPVNVTLLCPDNTVIILGDAIYGRNTYGACTLVDGDCMETTDIFASCKGLQNCTITLEKTYSPQCGYITFLKVNYDCRTGNNSTGTAVLLTNATQTFNNKKPTTGANASAK